MIIKHSQLYLGLLICTEIYVLRFARRSLKALPLIGRCVTQCLEVQRHEPRDRVDSSRVDTWPDRRTDLVLKFVLFVMWYTQEAHGLRSYSSTSEVLGVNIYLVFLLLCFLGYFHPGVFWGVHMMAECFLGYFHPGVFWAVHMMAAWAFCFYILFSDLGN